MSKAFTREDDDAGFVAPKAAKSVRVIRGLVTPRGAIFASKRAAELRASADANEVAHEIARLDAIAVAPVATLAGGEECAFGAEICLANATDQERIVQLGSPEEVGLIPHAISITSPLARALLGHAVGDDVELDTPRGHESWRITAVRWT